MNPKDTKLYMPFSEGSGTTCYDYSGNANNGTITGATYTKIQDGSYALNFDGSGDYITTSGSSTIIPDEDNFTFIIGTNPVENTDAAGTDNRLWTAYRSAASSSIALYYRNGHFWLYWRDSTATTTQYDLGAYTYDKWYMIAVQFNGSNLRVYINLIEALDTTTTSYALDSTTFDIGRYSSGGDYYFEGLLRLPISVQSFLSFDKIKKHYQQTYIN